MSLVTTPTLNKGTAFTYDERTRFDLHGLLPLHVETLDDQVNRAYQAYLRKQDDLERHIYLRQLQDTNEVLFYRLVLDHIDEMMPIVYTPTVAQGCQLFSKIYRRPRGLFISYPLRDRIPELLRSRPNREVDVVVVTDGERILGIGDQGVGGLGIPIGKLALYTLIGGIDPARTLPIVLDVGTNNQELLNDPEYLGWRHERITGKDYDEFIDQFVEAVKDELPNTCLQWEDFATPHARPILQHYRDELLTFNDDIQGTAAVALGVVLSALRVSGGSLKDQKFVFLGAGSASIGVADYLRQALVVEGLSEEQARSQFWIVDKDGLLHSKRADLSAEQQVYAQNAESVADWPKTFNGTIGLADVIGKVDANVLLGFSTVGGAFTEAIVREMARKVARPIILPLSNPTSKAEAKPDDLIRWTDGKALVATGSPFPPVKHGESDIFIAQCNNVYIFPAVGLGLVASGATRVTDGMLLAAAHALAENSPALKNPTAPLLPVLTDVRKVAVEMAVAVGVAAQNEGLAPKTNLAALRSNVISCQWSPEYSDVDLSDVDLLEEVEVTQ
ncbi:malate dehydrogenase (oxaloacetate-decarboxylating) [Edaphobacter modestus]|uniref:Malate dehydrogenase (Oxaloacetate-decarboxylating) n=2 Tax=Edaphobacter modestus TaxID=388466 RepID=A0A4Q7YS64_9BACT|nr:malate dehydrogenase (oxaloacetate-decarboxylating) [Edaphobacter modestus]